MTSVVSRAGGALLAVLATVFLVLSVSVPAVVWAQQSSDAQFLRLSIDEVTPSVVSATDAPVVKVTGTVTNVGDRAVEDVVVRLQRAPAVTESEELRSSLVLDQSGFDVVGEFEEISDRIDQGERERFTLQLPLRSETSLSLGIDTPGVYPLLVNVNGVPEYGGAARLDDARFLLPVLEVPASKPTAGERAAGTTPSPAVTPTSSSPVAMSMLWPLADTPRRAAGVPGSTTDPMRLVDDDLASSLADGGRLDGLLSVAETTITQTPRVAEALCLAVDPDLLTTVAGMTRDYLVVDDPADPLGDAQPGSGTDAAVSWLTRLRELSSGMCTTSVPFAQVDPVALAELDEPILSATALQEPAVLVDSILGIESLPAVVWPDSGVLTERAGTLLAANGPVTALLARGAVQVPDETTVTTRISGVDGLTAALFDDAAAAAFAATGSDPQTPSFVSDDLRFDPSDNSATARLQDALGATVWPALADTGTSGGTAGTAPAGSPAGARSVLFAPPQVWSASESEALAIVSTMHTLMESGLAEPRPVRDVVAEAAALVTDPVTSLLTYPERALVDGVPAALAPQITELIPRLSGITDAMVEDPQVSLTPMTFVTPLYEDMVRALTLSGRRGTDPGRAAQTAEQRVGQVRTSIDRMYSAVTVLPPGGVYTLTSEQSPLLLVARNDLPVGVTVLLHIDAPPSMEITDIGAVQLPPRGSRTLTVPARISDSRNLEVEFTLTTEAGLPLGDPAEVAVRSNAYGRILAVVTGCAGALLLFLAGRRLLHRFRGEPDPADEGYKGR